MGWATMQWNFTTLLLTGMVTNTGSVRVGSLQAVMGLV